VEDNTGAEGVRASKGVHALEEDDRQSDRGGSGGRGRALAVGVELVCFWTKRIDTDGNIYMVLKPINNSST
jgi:hypothetical protein